MANLFSDPFSNPDAETADTAASPLPRLRSRSQRPVEDDALPEQFEAGEPGFVDDRQVPYVPPFRSPFAGEKLLTEPMKGQEPTEFQKMRVNWSDGGEDLSRPRLRNVAPSDWLEVDYTYGKKEGASDKPVEAANVYGRQFTRDELMRDDEGRRLLELMQERRAGKQNEGGSLYRFGKGWANWSASDIPFYGWVSDIGTSVGEAIDISKTMRKLQDGGKVTPHEAIQARRYMLQQEIEGTRSMAYNVGQVTRQMVPFMAEMAATSFLGAKIGALIGPWGAGIGGVTGAVIGAGKWLLTAGKYGGRAGAKYVANRAMKSLAAKAAEGLTASELGEIATAGVKAYGRKGFGLAYREAFDAVRKASPELAMSDVRRTAMGRVADGLSRNTIDQSVDRIGVFALRGLLNGDAQLAAHSGAMKAAEEFLARHATTEAVDLSKMSTRRLNALVRQGLKNIGGFESDAWKAFRKDLSSGFVKGLDGKLKAVSSVSGETSVGAGFLRNAMAETTGQWISPEFANAAANVVFSDAVKTLELRLGGGFLNGAERFRRYLGGHIVNGLVRSEHSILMGGSPTVAHSGMSSFFRSSDALKEGLGRVFVEAPVTAAVQLGLSQTVTAPLFAAASGHNPLDVTFKGQLGFQTAALLRGDRDAMDSARMCAIGSMFAEYASENAGRGLGLMLGGAAGVASLKTAAQLTQGIDIAKKAVASSGLTRKAGDILSKAVDVVYGTGDLMKGGTDKLVGLATSRVAEWVGKEGRQIAEADVRNAIETMSLKGTSESFRELLRRQGIESASGFRKAVIEQTQELNRFGVLRACFGAELLRRGLSPDEIVRKFRQMGKGGWLEEMGEERVGDFVRGLMGWDDSQSDADVGDKLKAAFSGFTDPEQLMTEAIAFAIPGAARSTTMSMQKWLMNGGLTPTRDAVTRAKNLERCASGRPRVVADVGSDENAEALAERTAGVEALKAKAYGTDESYGRAVTANAAAAFASRDAIQRRVDELNPEVEEPAEEPAGEAAAEGEGQESPDETFSDPGEGGGEAGASSAETGKSDAAYLRNVRELAKGRVAGVLGAQSEEHMRTQLRQFADSFLDEPNESALENALADSDAVEILGEPGVDAVRRRWASAEGHSFSDDSPISSDIKAYEDARKAPFERRETTYGSAREAAEAVFASSPILGRNASQTAEQEDAARTGSNVEDMALNADVADAALEDFATIYGDMGRAAFIAPQEGSRMRRFLSRVVGALGAVSTGELALVAENPTMWIARDKGLDASLNMDGLAAYSSGLLAGYRKIRDGLDADVRERLDKALGDGTFLSVLRDSRLDVPTVAEMERAGADEFRGALKKVVGSYLTGCGYLALSRGDARDAALKVVAARHRKGNRYDVSSDPGAEDTVPSFSDPRFAERWAPEIDAAETEVVDELVRMASGAMDYDSSPALGSNRVSVTVDVARAIRNGTPSEVVNAILDSPSFGGVGRSVNVSGHSELESEVAFSAALSRSADIGAILSIDVDTAGREITESEILSVSEILGINTDKSDAENQASVRKMVRAVRLAVESANVDFEDTTDRGRTAVIIPVSSDSGRSFVLRVSENGVRTDVPCATWMDAKRAAEADGLSIREKRLVVSTVGNFVSSDAASAVLLMCGNDRVVARSAYLDAMGATDDHVPFGHETLLPPYLRKMQRNENGQKTWDWVDRSPEWAANGARAAREERVLADEYRTNGGLAERYLTGLVGRVSAEELERARVDRVGRALDAYNAVYGPEATRKSAPGYEVLAERILRTAGIRRAPSTMASGLNSMGVSSDAWVVPTSAISTRDAVILTPDYSTEGHSEALLREGLRGAISAYLREKAPDAATRKAIMAEAYREFVEAADELAKELEGRHPDKAKRILQAVYSVLGHTVEGVKPGSVAAMASASVFFTCERSIRGTGNGFSFSPELARIADRFRNKPIYPFFASALDEATGGIGFFHAATDSKGDAIGSATGLARFLSVFCDDKAAVFEGRKSAMFTNDTDDRPVFPYLPSLVLRDVQKDALLADGAVVADVVRDGRFNRFDGDVKGGYVPALANACSSFATRYFSALGGTRTVLSTSEAFSLFARDATLFGGNAKGRAEQAERAGESEVTDGAKPLVAGVTTAAAKMLSKDRNPVPLSGVDADTVNDAGAAIKAAALASGQDEGAFLNRVGEYLRNRGVPDDVVDDVSDAYVNVDILNDDTGADAQEERDAAQDEDNAAMAEGAKAEDVWGSRRELAIADSADVAAVSRVVRLVFPAQRGSVAFTLSEFKSEVCGGLVSDEAVGAAKASLFRRGGAAADAWERDVREFVRALNPYSDPDGFLSFIAKDPFYPRVANGRKETGAQCAARVDRMLDSVIRLFSSMGRYDLAITVAALRNIPVRDGRRTKLLENLVHLTPCEAMTVERTDEGFVLGRTETIAEQESVSRAVASASTMILESPELAPSVSSGLSSDFAAGLARLVVGHRLMALPSRDGKTLEDAPYQLAKFIGPKKGADGKWRYDPGWPRTKPLRSGAEGIPVLCGDSPEEATETYNAIMSVFGAEKVPFEDYVGAVDALFSIIRERAGKCADAVDGILGTGSDFARMFRNVSMFSVLRRRVVEAYDGLDSGKAYLREARKDAVVTAFQLCNYFTRGVDVNKTDLAWTIHRNSMALEDAVGETVEALSEACGVPLRGKAAKTLWLSEIKGNDRYDPAKVAALVAKYRDAYAVTLPEKPNFSKTRAFLARLATVNRVKEGTHLDYSIDVGKALAEQNRTVTHGHVERPMFAKLFDAYVSAAPQTTRNLAGRSLSLSEAAKERAVTTLPCPLPALTRAMGSDLFGIEGAAKELARNGGTWDDGSRPIVSVIGAKDANGAIIDKAFLAGILRESILREKRQGFHSDRAIFPIFRGDSPSCFALQVPSRIVDAWVEKYARDDKARLALPKVVREFVDVLVSPPQVVAGNPSGYVNHSGGAAQADSTWGEIGREYGVESRHYYYKTKTPSGNVDISTIPGAYEEGVEKYKAAAPAMGRHLTSKPYVLALMSRNWQQVKNSDAVFAIGRSGRKSPTFDGDNVNGGTGYAVQMAKNEGKPVHVFDQESGKWFAWKGGKWVEEDTPVLTRNFAGIGTHDDLTEVGVKAIRDVYEKTFAKRQGSASHAVEVVNAPGGSKDAARYANEIGGVNTLRIPNAKFHFGNPFSTQDYRGVTRKVGTIKEAVEHYESWLRGTTDQDLEPERRKFIVDAISSGKLDGRKLVYYTDDVDHGDYDGTGKVSKYDRETAPHHAHVLAKLVEEHLAAKPAEKPSESPADAAADDPVREYEAVESLVGNADGQSQVDAKRKQVTLAVGNPIATFAAGEDGKVAPYAGLYTVSVMGGATGTQLTGSYFLSGCVADRMSALVDGRNLTMAQKLHVFGIEDGSVNLKKGQGFAHGLGFEAEDGEHFTMSLYRRHQAIARRTLERIAGSALPKADGGLLEGMEGILDPVPSLAEGGDEAQWKACKAAHDLAVRAVEPYLAQVSIMTDDEETDKAGLFGNRCGFWTFDGRVDELTEDGKPIWGYDESGAPVVGSDPGKITVSVEVPKPRAEGPDGKPAGEPQTEVREVTVLVRDGDGWRTPDEVSAVTGIDVAEETKNGRAPIKRVLCAVAASVGKDLSAAQVGSIEGVFRRPDGSAFRGKLSDLLPKGDRISVRWDAETGCALVEHFTRKMVAQKVADNSNSSRPTDDHTAAVNTTRDEEILEMLRNEIAKISGEVRGNEGDSTDFTDAHVGFSLLQLAQLAQSEDILREAILSDPEVQELVKTRSNGNDVAQLVSDKVRSFYARQCIVGFCGTHGVMGPSSVNGHVPVSASRFDHTVELDRNPYASDYDVDALKPATVYTSPERALFRQDRSYGSGLVNTRERTFRYGWYLDEAALDAATAKLVPEDFETRPYRDGRTWGDRIAEIAGVMKPAKAAAASKYAAKRAKNRAADAVAAKASAVARIEWLFDAMRSAGGKDAARYRKAIMESFRDYTGNQASESWNADTVSFDDLYRRDGTFDLAALDFTEGRSMTFPGETDGSRKIFLGGSFFIAHRSPSGNIEAYSGVVRATAPVSFSTKPDDFGRPGAESVYTLDGITMITQGSDTDGDSAGVQVRNGSASAADRTSRENIRKFVGLVLKGVGSYDSTYRSLSMKYVWDLARKFGFTETEGGREVISRDVLTEFANAVFDAQVENYRNMRVVHQGFVGDSSGENAELVKALLAMRGKGDKRGSARSKSCTRDVFYGYEFADYYAAHPLPGGRKLYDYGFLGRQPVGADAVFEEPVTAKTVGRVLDLLDSDVPKSVKDLVREFGDDGKRVRMNKLLKDIVKKVAGPGSTAITNPKSAVETADAASDSAGARGKSVFHQSRFLRAFARRFGLHSMDIVSTLPKSYGYSPLADFDAHVDGISNNLFDTLKEMFAKRAGWTKAMLPYFLGKVAYEGCRAAAAGERLDSAFFLAHAVNFLCQITPTKALAEAGYDYNVRTPIGRVAFYTDPVRGRDNLISVLSEFEIPGLRLDGGDGVSEKASVRDLVRRFASATGLRSDGAWADASGEARLVILASRLTRKNVEAFKKWKGDDAKVEALRKRADALKKGGAGRAAVDDAWNAYESAKAEVGDNPFLHPAADEDVWVEVANDILTPVKEYGDRVDYMVRVGWDPATFESKTRNREGSRLRQQGEESPVTTLQEIVGDQINLAVASRSAGYSGFDRTLSETVGAVLQSDDANAALPADAVRDMLFVRGKAKKDGKAAWRKNYDTFAEGEDVRNNQDRLVHVVGLCAPRFADTVRAVLGKFAKPAAFGSDEGPRPSTAGFVTGFTEFVFGVSHGVVAGLFAKCKNGTVSGDRLADGLLASLNARNGLIDCTAGYSSAEIDALRAGFTSLMKQATPFTVGKVSMTGREIAVGLLLHAGITKPYGAAMDYHGKSSLPAVFDGRFVAEYLESFRPYVLANPTVNLLTALKPLEVPTGKRPVKAFDIARTIDIIAGELAKSDEVPHVRQTEFMDSLVAASHEQRRVRLDSEDEFSTEDGYKFRKPERVRVAKGSRTVLGVDTVYGDPATTVTEFGRKTDTGFETRYMLFETPWMDEDGEIRFHRRDPKARKYSPSLEAAFNAALALEVERVKDSPALRARAEAFRRNNGRGFVWKRKFVTDAATGGRREVPSGIRRKVYARILENAAKGNSDLYEVLSKMQGRPVRHVLGDGAYEAGDPSLAAAVNDVAGRIADGLVRNPSASVATEADERPSFADGGADAPAAGVTGVTRMDFVRRIGEVFPGGELTADMATRNMPQAVTDAFKALFGDSVEVEQLKVDGEPTAMVKVTRDTGNGKVVTFVSFGESLGYDSSDGSFAASMVEMINARRAEADPSLPKLTARDVDRLTGGNLKTLISMARATGRTLGSSSRLRRDLGFAKYMSGVVRLDHKAGFATLFHEYYHQMVGCFRDNGVVDSADLSELDAKFASEEAAADAYAEYLTGASPRGLPAEGAMLKNYAGERDPAVRAIFDRLRRASAALATIGYRGDDGNGVPCFVRVAMAPTESLGETDAAEVGRVAVALFREPGRFDTNTVLTADQLSENADLFAKAVSALAAGGDATEYVLLGEDNLKGPVDLEQWLSPESPSPEAGEPAREAKPLPSDPVTAVTRVLSAAVARVSDGGASKDFAKVVRSLKISELTTGRLSDTSRLSQIVFNARALLRYTAVAEGFEIERHGEPTELGRALLTNENAAALALRLIDAATLEKEAEDEGRVRDDHDFATNAGATRTFARLLEYASPLSWGSHAKALAQKAADEFSYVADALSAKADAHPDNEKSLRDQASALYETARLVKVYSDAAARGRDLHFLLSDPDSPYAANKGNLHGLFFAFVTGGASFYENGGWGNVGKTRGPRVSFDPDGIRRYAKDSSILPLDGDVFDDPAVVAGFDYAAQAFFVAAAARSYNRQAHGTMKAEDAAEVVPALTEGLGEIDPNLTSQSTLEAPAWFGRIDTNDTTPDWILANEGTWLAGDMQRSLSGISLRDAMTDHSARASCESAYRLCADMSQFFGMDTLAGDRVRVLKYVTSTLGRDGNGNFAIDDDYAHAAESFSQTRGYLLGIFNLAEEREGETLDGEDLKEIDLAGQTVKSICSRDRDWISGIRVRDLAYQDEVLSRIDGADVDETMSPAAVLARLNDRSREPGKGFTQLDVLLERVLEELPMSVVRGDSVRDVKWTDVKRVSDIKGGYYANLLKAVIAAADAARADERAAKRRNGTDPKDSLNSAIAGELVRAGFAVKGRKKDVYLSIRTADLAKAWDSSEAKRKLVAAGRPEKLLNLYWWAHRVGREVSRLNTAASKSSYLTAGAGANFAGSTVFWWHGGTGGHARDVSRFRAASDLFKGLSPSADDRLEKVQDSVFGKLERLTTATLRQRAFDEHGGFSVPTQTVDYLATKLGAKGGGRPFRYGDFAAAVARGEYEDGEIPVDRNATVMDVVLLANRILSEDNFEDIVRGTDLPATERQRLLDVRTVCDRVAAKVKDTVPGVIVPMSEESQFKYGTGELGDYSTAPEALAQMCRDLVTAERFRGCLAQMLTSVSPDGSPLYVVSPSDALAKVNGMPDEYWGALARHVLAASSAKTRGLVAYDEALTGVENMQRIYDALAKSDAKKSYSEIGLDDYGVGLLFEKPILCYADPRDSAGNVDVATAVQGGEAACYMKQLLATLNAPTTGAVWRAIDTVSSWTKIASVGFSAFFQIATVIESPTAAAGFANTILGMTKTGTKLNRAVAKRLGRKGGAGAFNSDTPLLSDLVELANSNDPFMVQARELCDLMRMPLDPVIPFNADDNAGNPILGTTGTVKRQSAQLVALAGKFGNAGFQRQVRKTLDFMYKHPTDYTFNVVLNGVKMAVVMQTMRRLREECRRGSRPFDPVRELRKYSAYINAEIGGIDPARYAWATPKMRRYLAYSMFSWQWTVGAWEAGGGSVVSDLLFGGHNSTPESRQWSFVRWLRMLGIVKFGIPVVLQAVIKTLSLAMYAVLPPDDDRERDELLEKEVDDLPWLCLLNESKAGALSFDVTPLLKLAGRIPGVEWLKLRGQRPGADGQVIRTAIGAVAGTTAYRNLLIGGTLGAIAGNRFLPTVSSLVPAYVGGGRNTTGMRRYYMHFGKQSDEFFRWFEAPASQALAKTSIPLQKILEGLFGGLNPQGYRKAFADKSLGERWLNLDLSDPDESALANLVWSMTSFSAQSVASNPDAGLFAAVGPMRMGQSKRSTRLRIVDRLKEFAEGGGGNDPWNYSRNRRRLNLMCTDILREGQLNGIPPDDILKSALGDVTKGEYLRVMSALPKDIRTNSFDVPQLRKAITAVTRVDRKTADIMKAIVDKYDRAGTNVDSNPAFKRAVRDVIRFMQASPVYYGDDEAERTLDLYLSHPGEAVRSTNTDAKGGRNFSNFLATDDVPPTLFGVPVTTADNGRYTEGDLEFFREHPEAGGYYSMGDES